MDPLDTSHRLAPGPADSVSLFISLACISVMSLLFGRKTAATKLSSINYARGLVVGLYLVSWLFSLVAAMLVQTNDFNKLSCDLSIFMCILLYALSKVLIYLFLIERVHIVTAVGITRWNCPMFKFNMLLLLPYSGIFVLAIIYRIANMGPDGICRIGLARPAGVPLIIYDIFIISWLTALFLRALLSSTSMLQGPTKSRLREVARRTLMGSIWALILSGANIAALVYFNGYERGLTCMASCTVDVTLNAITIHWVTSRASNSRNDAAFTSRDAEFAMQGIDKHIGPVESHISVSIESYVEEYRQMNIAGRRTSERYQ